MLHRPSLSLRRGMECQQRTSPAAVGLFRIPPGEECLFSAQQAFFCLLCSRTAGRLAGTHASSPGRHQQFCFFRILSFQPSGFSCSSPKPRVSSGPWLVLAIPFIWKTLQLVTLSFPRLFPICPVTLHLVALGMLCHTLRFAWPSVIITCHLLL